MRNESVLSEALNEFRSKREKGELDESLLNRGSPSNTGNSTMSDEDVQEQDAEKQEAAEQEEQGGDVDKQEELLQKIESIVDDKIASLKEDDEEVAEEDDEDEDEDEMKQDIDLADALEMAEDELPEEALSAIVDAVRGPSEEEEAGDDMDKDDDAEKGVEKMLDKVKDEVKTDVRKEIEKAFDVVETQRPDGAGQEVKKGAGSSDESEAAKLVEEIAKGERRLTKQEKKALDRERFKGGNAGLTIQD